MLSIPGKSGATCDGQGGVDIKRREFMRVGGAGLLGMSLSQVLALQAKAGEKAKADEKTQGAEPAKSRDQKPGFGKAKSVILLFLQGGPSHIDIWDPKPDAPSNVRGEFN